MQGERATVDMGRSKEGKGELAEKEKSVLMALREKFNELPAIWRRIAMGVAMSSAMAGAFAPEHAHAQAPEKGDLMKSLPDTAGDISVEKAKGDFDQKIKQMDADLKETSPDLVLLADVHKEMGSGGEEVNTVQLAVDVTALSGETIVVKGYTASRMEFSKDNKGESNSDFAKQHKQFLSVKETVQVRDTGTQVRAEAVGATEKEAVLAALAEASDSQAVHVTGESIDTQTEAKGHMVKTSEHMMSTTVSETDKTVVLQGVRVKVQRVNDGIWKGMYQATVEATVGNLTK